MPSADLDAAAEGVMRSAFGLQGQKCSACSRVYLHREVKARFLDLLMALRLTEASVYTLRDTPSFTCVAHSISECLDMIG